MNVLTRLLPSLAVALAAMFFAIAAYINIGEQPARLALANGPLLAQWKISVGIATPIQATLAIVTGIVALATWWLTRSWQGLIGGLLMLANWPWTLMMIAPINSALVSTPAEAAGPTSRALIEQWGQLHAVRTSFGLLALLLFIWASSRSHA